MANSTTTFLTEAATAARGTVALLVGNRQAPSYFDFRQVGVVGSFIALLIGLAAQAFGPHLMGRGASGAVSSALILAGLVLALQFGAAWLLLRLLKRGDGFVPFVVSHNWVIFFQSLLAVAIFVIFGEPFSIDPTGGNGTAHERQHSLPAARHRRTGDFGQYCPPDHDVAAARCGSLRHFPVAGGAAVAAAGRRIDLVVSPRQIEAA